MIDLMSRGHLVLVQEAILATFTSSIDDVPTKLRTNSDTHDRCA